MIRQHTSTGSTIVLERLTLFDHLGEQMLRMEEEQGLCERGIYLGNSTVQLCVATMCSILDQIQCLVPVDSIIGTPVHL